MTTGVTATPAELCSVLAAIDLLDPPTLRVGWDGGWVDRQAAVDAAVRLLVASPDEADDDVVALAGADDADDEAVAALVAGLAERAAPVPADEISRRWWLAHLEVLLARGLPPGNLVEAAEQMWAELGYPPELERLSPYYAGPEPDPARAPADLRWALRAELGIGSR